MNKKRLKRIISLALGIVMLMPGDFIVHKNRVSAEDIELAGYRNPAIFMEDYFGASGIIPGEEKTNASGWDVSGDGGYITGRNTFGGFYLVDTTDTDFVKMTKNLNNVSGDILCWNVVVRIEKSQSSFNMSLDTQKDEAITLMAENGNLSVKAADAVHSIGNYSAGVALNLKAVINTKTNTFNLFKNGICVLSNAAVSGSDAIKSASFYSGTKSVGRMNIIRSILYSDYIIRDDFEYESSNDQYIKYGSAAVSEQLMLDCGTAGVSLSHGNIAYGDRIATEYKMKASSNTPVRISGLYSKPEEAQTITENKNLLPDVYQNCDGDIGADYEWEQDTTQGFSDSTSIKLLPSRAVEIFSFVIPKEDIEPAANYRLTFKIKKGKNLMFGGDDTTTAQKVSGFRTVTSLKYTTPDGTEKSMNLGDYWENTQNVFADNTLWQTGELTFKMPENLYNNLPEDAQSITGIRLHVRPNLGGWLSISDNIWLDEITLKKELKDSESSNILSAIYECDESALDNWTDSYKSSVVDTEVYHHGSSSKKVIGTGYDMINYTINNKFRASKKTQNYRLGFWYKKSADVKDTSVRPFLRARYTGTDGQSHTVEHCPIIPIKDTTEWQKVEMTFTHNYEFLPEGGADFGAIQFLLRRQDGWATDLGEGSIWIDEFELYEIPEEEIKTSLISSSHTTGVETSKFILKFDTAYVSLSALEAANLSINGERLATGSYRMIKSGNQVLISLTPSVVIDELTIEGLRDIWGRDVICGILGKTLCELRINDSKIVENDNIIADFVPDVWNNVKTVYDTSTGNCDIYINHIKKGSVKASPGIPDMLYFGSRQATSGFAVDNVRVYKEQLPDNYVPKPQKVTTDYYTSILACNLWREEGGRGWDAISGFDERSPEIGFYDENNPEVSDWEIKFMTEHGIDCEIFCWYHEDITGKDNGINAFKDAKYSDMMDYAIMWTNSGSEYLGDMYDNYRNKYVPFWIEHYFKDPRYSTVDQKPVLYIFSSAALLEDFGGVEGMAAEFEYLEEKCIEAGLPGVKIYLYSNGVLSGDEQRELVEAGIVDGYFLYGYKHRSPEAVKSRYKTDRDINIPILAVRNNVEAWDGGQDTYTSPDTFLEIAKTYKNELLPDWDFSKMSKDGTKMIILDNWNEYGEGHFMMPTKKLGFGYLDAFRSVFCEEEEHTDILPDDEQRARITRLYPEGRIRRAGADTSSSDKREQVIKKWDFEGNHDFEKDAYIYPDGSYVTTLRFENPRVEDGILKGIATESQTLVFIHNITGVDLSKAPGFIINSDTYIDEGAMYFKTDTVDDYSAALLFNANWNKGIFEERKVYMNSHPEWKGELKSLILRVPTDVGNEFSLKSIAVIENESIFSVGDEIIKDNSFEDGDNLYSCELLEASVQHRDFNKGATSLKVINKTGGSISWALDKIKANTSYTFEAYTKRPYGKEKSGELSAWIEYKEDGRAKATQKLTLPVLPNDGFAKLAGEFDIISSEDIYDARLVIGTNLGDGEEFYIDDLSLREYTTAYSQELYEEYNPDEGVIISFDSEIDCENVSVAGISDVGECTWEKLADNAILITPKTLKEGTNEYVISGIKTVMGEHIGVIKAQIINEPIIKTVYYKNYKTENEEELSADTLSGDVTAVTTVDNMTIKDINLNVYYAFYNGESLIQVSSGEISAKANNTDSSESAFSVPESYTDFKAMVWEKEKQEPLN